MTRTRPRLLAACLALAASILISWFWPPSRALWDALDLYWFRLANGSLCTGGEAWRVTWAIANHRAFDLIPGGLLLALFAASAWREHRHELSRLFATGLFMAAYCLASIQIARLLVLEPRLSPTRVIPDACRLQTLVPSIAAKDNSSFSFPGDHATVMCIVTVFIWHFCGRKYGIAAALVAIIFSIPRTVGGAHWATDVLVGASVIALASCSIALCTTLAGRSIAAIQRTIEPHLRKIFPKIFR